MYILLLTSECMITIVAAAVCRPTVRPIVLNACPLLFGSFGDELNTGEPVDCRH